MSDRPLARLLGSRFTAHRPRRTVQASTRALGWIARRLPPRPRVRAVLDRTLGPAIAWSIRRLPALFDLGDAAEPLAPFDRAVYGWMGVEGSVMRYGGRFHLPVIDEARVVERLYHRDGAGRRPGGCPWGLRRAEDGFACRTIMMGSRHVFAGLGDAHMKVDIGIPEMLAIERLVADHLAASPGATVTAVWEALAPAIVERFRASAPVEDDFFPGGELRPETRAVIDDLIAAMIEGRRPPIFCQFRIVP